MRSTTFLRAAGALAGTLLAATLLAAPVAAGEPTTWYVGPTPVSSAGPGGPCDSPDFGSIQDAVDASGPRDTIRVCPGTYDEGVIIAGNGHRGLTISAVERWKAVVRPAQAVAGYLAGFRVDDTRLVRIIGMRIISPTSGICASVDYGIRLNAGARKAIIRANRIAATGTETLFGSCGLSVGVSVADGASAKVLWNTIRNFRTTGVEVLGAGSAATIARNSIQFRHTDNDAFVTQAEGVNIINDAWAAVRDNRFVGIPSTAPASGPAAPPANSQLRYGVRASDAAADLVIRDNLVRYAYRGIKVTNSDGARVRANTVRDVLDIGIRFVGADQGWITDNRVKDAGTNGISMESGSGDNTIARNDVAGNGAEDCRDDTTGSGTGGTGNLWAPDNIADDETPAGICIPI
jgi:hypothetical protein